MRLAIGLLGLLFFGSAQAQIVLNADENVNFRFGFQAQFWADARQDFAVSSGQGYQQNLYLRRIRLLLSGQLAKDVTFFFQTDQPNLGKSPKTPNAGFLVQDAFLEWKIANAFRLDGGLMLVPLARNTLQSTTSYYGLDISPISTINNSATQSSGLRDFGLQARGFFLANHLTYRLGVFDGERAPNARNALRTAGYLQLDLFDPELGYTMLGTALGKQKILALSTGFDRQGAYHANSAGLAADWPVRGGDEIGGQFQYIHYDGSSRFPAIAAQHDFMAEAAYYLKSCKLQPFARLERQNFVSALNAAKEYDRFGGGLNYYVHKQNLKLTLQLQRAVPRLSSLKPSLEATFQLQVFYF